jgi:hypothetical protein
MNWEEQLSLFAFSLSLYVAIGQSADGMYVLSQQLNPGPTIHLGKVNPAKKQPGDGDLIP